MSRTTRWQKATPGGNERAGRMGVAAADVGSARDTQRGADSTRVSDRAMGLGRYLPAALGSVRVEGSRHCPAPAGWTLGVSEPDLDAGAGRL